MRLGAYRCALRADTIARRRRTRDEIIVPSAIGTATSSTTYSVTSSSRSTDMRVLGGVNPERDLVEIIELHDHPMVRVGAVPSRNSSSQARPGRTRCSASSSRRP